MAKRDTFKLQLEVNTKFIDPDKYKFKIGNALILTSPLELNEDYWQFRVKIHDEQAIIGFPKFHQIAIGFAKEDNWNTNLPSGYDVEKIWEWIKENKYFASIPDERCKKAIKMIKDAAKSFQQAEVEAEDMIILSNEPMFKSEKSDKAISVKEFKSICNIFQAKRMETFVDSFTRIETKKRLYCILFGFDYENRRYKYRLSGYFFNREMAVKRFYYILRKYNLNGSLNTGDRWVSVKVAQNTNEGFKIPIALPQPF